MLSCMSLADSVHTVSGRPFLLDVTLLPSPTFFMGSGFSCTNNVQYKIDFIISKDRHLGLLFKAH